MARLCTCVLLLSLGVPSVAHADIITINPNNFAMGTDLSTLFEGLTMSRLDNSANQDGRNGGRAFDPIASGIYALPSAYTPALSVGGNMYLLHSYEECREGQDSAFPNCSVPYRVLELVFDTPTDYIQIAGFGGADLPAFYAYDAQGNRLNTITHFFSGPTFTDTVTTAGGSITTDSHPTTVNDRYLTTITMVRNERDIARIVYGGVSARSAATEINYRVPEPPTSAVLFVALGALAFVRSRKSQA